MSVHVFHGDKGGVGKSFASFAFGDWLIADRKIIPLIIDADMRNPDVARLFADVASTRQLDLREHDGWIELASLLSEATQSEILISLPAGIGDMLDREAADWLESMQQLHRDVVLYWVINRTADSVNLLRSALHTFQGRARAMVVIRNLFFGDADRFRRWNDSKTRQAFLEAGGREIELPDLHERIADLTAMALPAVPFSRADTLRFGDQAELRRWRQRTSAAFDSLAAAIGIGEPIPTGG